ncbi:flagellar biosynthetic protein FliO [Sneathiella limimaris]|uniref:flagellar biosynthetic protein FliO n=1 Tax=Sneathiella limimaris TaxID=1964213 RepID=UPI00146E0E6D|nr:flagellar biosynthetic protein FliO [Sneathiella limimaris]
MDLLLYAKYLVVLVFVLGLITLIAYAVRRFGFVPSAEKHRSSKRRLAISQMIGLDAKRRLVLVRRDDQEHLLLLGPDGDLVVESNIPAPKKHAKSEHSEPQANDAHERTEDLEADGHQEPKFPSLKPLHLRGNAEE